MPQRRRDPYAAYRFRVEIDAITVSDFLDVAGLDGTIETIEFREGSARGGFEQLSGSVHYDHVVLVRALDDSHELYDWWKQARDEGAEAARRNASVVLMDERGNDRSRWNISNAWPVRYAVGPFASARPAPLVETVTLVHEGFERA